MLPIHGTDVILFVPDIIIVLYPGYTDTEQKRASYVCVMSNGVITTNRVMLIFFSSVNTDDRSLLQGILQSISRANVVRRVIYISLYVGV